MVHRSIFTLFVLVISSVLFSIVMPADRSWAGRKNSAPDIWLVYFGSSDCPQCETINILLDKLSNKNRLKIKHYDIEDDKNYALFKKVESIHGESKFSVPLIIISDDILVGVDEIKSKLPKFIKSLAKKGADPPYLGPGEPVHVSRRCDRSNNSKGG